MLYQGNYHSGQLEFNPMGFLWKIVWNIRCRIFIPDGARELAVGTGWLILYVLFCFLKNSWVKRLQILAVGSWGRRWNGNISNWMSGQTMKWKPEGCGSAQPTSANGLFPFIRMYPSKHSFEHSFHEVFGFGWSLFILERYYWNMEISSV